MNAVNYVHPCLRTGDGRRGFTPANRAVFCPSLCSKDSVAKGLSEKHSEVVSRAGLRWAPEVCLRVLWWDQIKVSKKSLSLLSFSDKLQAKLFWLKTNNQLNWLLLQQYTNRNRIATAQKVSALASAPASWIPVSDSSAKIAFPKSSSITGMSSEAAFDSIPSEQIPNESKWFEKELLPFWVSF